MCALCPSRAPVDELGICAWCRTDLEIADAYEAGEHAADIAADLTVPLDKVWRAVHRRGVELRGRPDARRAQRVVTDRWLRDMTALGLSIGEMSRRAGVDRRTIKERLARIGLWRSDQAPPDETLRRLYHDEGLTIAEVAERIDRGPRITRLYLLAAGVELRHAGRRSQT